MNPSLSSNVALRGAATTAPAHLPAELRATPLDAVRTFNPGEVIEEEGGQGRSLQTLLTGWAAEARTLHDGRRQIMRLVLPGDHCGISGGAGSPALCGLFALTRVRLVDHGPVLSWMDRPPVVRWLSNCAVDLQKGTLDHLWRLGAMTAEQRTAHLLLETYQRLARVGLAEQGEMELPVTQAVLAETLGLSIVHINRVLQRLKAGGFIHVGGGRARLNNLAGLASKCDFDLSPVEPGPAVIPQGRSAPRGFREARSRLS